MTAIEVLQKYEEWEVKLLNDENIGFLDALNTELYEEFLNLQRLRNNLLYKAAKEELLED